MPSCRHIERCPKCPSRGLPEGMRKNVVPGDGPERARVMLVLEGPGRLENNFKRPAVGKTGDELGGVYFPLAGLSRQEVYVTNTFKCHWADSSDTPPSDVVRSCYEFHLRRELAEVQPEVVILAGGIACSILGWDVDLEHGMPRYGVDLLGHKCDVFPTYHPARGMHRSEDMQSLLDDFRTLRSFLRGQLKPLVDEYPAPSFYRLRSPFDLEDIMAGRWDDEIAVDTESVKTWKGYRSTIRYTPWCATFCIDPGEAFMVRVEDEEAWKAFGMYLRRFRLIDMHNAPHDWNVLRSAGILLDWNRIEDTMAMAYHDGRLPKGLKALSYRLTGARMRSFEDVVRPHGLVLAMEYIERASKMNWAGDGQAAADTIWKYCPECKGKGQIGVGRGKLRKYYQCDCEGGLVRESRIGRKLKRLMGDMDKGEEVDPWARWMGWEDDIEPLVAKLGPLPLASIEQAPEEEAIEYACSDAHGTRRIAPILRARVAEIRRKVR